MADMVRWSLEISKETDESLRSYLAQHGMPPSDFSKFVEDAVRWRVLDRTVAEVKRENADVPPEEIEAAISESLDAVRSERSSK